MYKWKQTRDKENLTIFKVSVHLILGIQCSVNLSIFHEFYC